MWWGNQDLELQEWEDFIKSNKTRILYIVMLVLNRNPQGYKEYIIQFIDFAFGECVTTIYWLANMKPYFPDINEAYKNTIIGHLENSGT